jgi:hypothetical protein
MSDTNQREVAEALFEHKRREAEINDALRQEHARREAAVKNIYRLVWSEMQNQITSNQRTLVLGSAATSSRGTEWLQCGTV